MSIFVDKRQLLTADDIQTPNPNLLTGTKDWSGDNWILSTGHSFNKNGKYLDFDISVQNWVWGGIGQTTYIKAGETYTFSAYVLGNYVSLFTRYDAGNNLPSARVDKNALTAQSATDWTRMSLTFSGLSDGYIFTRVETNGPTLQVAGMKLERGSKATEWCPNVNDYAMQSDLDSLKESIEALKSKMGGAIARHCRLLATSRLEVA